MKELIASIVEAAAASGEGVDKVSFVLTSGKVTAVEVVLSPKAEA